MYFTSVRSNPSPKPAEHQQNSTIGIRLNKENALKLAQVLIEYQSIETEKDLKITVAYNNVNEEGFSTTCLIDDSALPKNYKTYLFNTGRKDRKSKSIWATGGLDPEVI